MLRILHSQEKATFITTKARMNSRSHVFQGYKCSSGISKINAGTFIKNHDRPKNFWQSIYVDDVIAFSPSERSSGTPNKSHWLLEANLMLNPKKCTCKMTVLQHKLPFYIPPIPLGSLKYLTTEKRYQW